MQSEKALGLDRLQQRFLGVTGVLLIEFSVIDLISFLIVNILITICGC